MMNIPIEGPNLEKIKYWMFSEQIAKEYYCLKFLT